MGVVAFHLSAVQLKKPWIAKMTSNQNLRFYSEQQLLRRLPFSRTTLWRQCKRGNFPSPVKISPGRVGWEAEAADAAIAAMIGGPENGENEEATDAAS